MKRKISLTSAMLLCLVLALSAVYAVTLWNKTISSNVNTTITSNAELYSDSSCTTILTSFVLPSVDILDLTTYSTSPIMYLKYLGSDTVTPTHFVITKVTGDSAFTFSYCFNSGTWTAMGTSILHTWVHNEILPFQIRFIQNTAHGSASGYACSFDIEIT